MNTGKWRGRTLRGEGTARTKAEVGQRELHCVSLCGTQNLFGGGGLGSWARALNGRPGSQDFILQPWRAPHRVGGSGWASMCVPSAYPFNVSRRDGTSCVVFSEHQWRDERTPGKYAW